MAKVNYDAFASFDINEACDHFDSTDQKAWKKIGKFIVADGQDYTNVMVATAIAMPAARAMEPRSTATTADEHVKKRRHTQGETSRTFRTWPSMTYLRR